MSLRRSLSILSLVAVVISQLYTGGLLEIVSKITTAQASPPQVLDIPYTEDRKFLQDQNVIDWNTNTCFDHFYFIDGNKYCDGFALKYYDNSASATKICNMKGYNTGTITSDGWWSSPHDNTIAYWNGTEWRTQSGT
ncbi:MAG: hypothetical protein ABIH58_01550, partial [Patescibacteria group bacterium]